MIFVEAHCEIQGVAFSPSEAHRRTTLKFDQATEPGQPVKRGRFKGQDAPFGFAVLAVHTPELGPPPPNGTEAHLGVRPGAIELGKLPNVVRSLQDCGAEQVVFQVNVSYVDQCNFEIAPTILELLYRAGVTVAVTCYEADEASASKRAVAAPRRPRSR